MTTVVEERKSTSHQALLNRFPCLVEYMRDAALLTDGEAASAIRDHLQGYVVAGCEAVDHFGGPLAVIRAAIEHRHTWRKYWGRWGNHGRGAKINRLTRRV